ncbi:unnamed protein product [Amaranthus hypochondriacus]
MENKLYDAAFHGNVTIFKELIQQDPLLLDRITLTDTPLHVAILRGHLQFVRALLSHNSRLATQSDSLGHLPLHVASAKGYLEIVRELLRVGPASACLSRSKDGKLPIHLAVMKAVRVEVVSELARASHESTRVRVDGGDTVLHLCVKYENLEGLRVLMEVMRSENDGGSLINSRNDDGNTVLHLAALYKNLEITKYLLAIPEIDPNAVNNNGLTPLNLVENSPKDLKTLELHNFLLQSNIPKSAHNPSSPQSPTKAQSNSPTQPNPKKSWKTFFTFTEHNINQLEDMKGKILITSALIAMINALPIIYLRVNGPDIPDQYSINSASFVPAVTIMVLLVAGLPLKNRFCAWLIVQLMYTALGFMGLNYIGEMISNESRYSRFDIALVFMTIWFALLMILSALNIIRLIVLFVTTIKRRLKRRNLRNVRENALSSA